MNKVLLAILALLMGLAVYARLGCEDKEFQKRLDIAAAKDKEAMEAVRLDNLRTDWYLKETALANEYTIRTWQCVTEMYSLAYDPVNSGPVCKESCVLLRRVNEMAAQAPPYIENPGKYALGDSKVCKERKKGR
jgi:hypothetical protein